MRGGLLERPLGVAHRLQRWLVFAGLTVSTWGGMAWLAVTGASAWHLLWWGPSFVCWAFSLCWALAGEA